MELHPVTRVPRGQHAHNLKLIVNILDSKGADYGGVTNQMFMQLSNEWTNPNLLMFVKVSLLLDGGCRTYKGAFTNYVRRKLYILTPSPLPVSRFCEVSPIDNTLVSSAPKPPPPTQLLT